MIEQLINSLADTLGERSLAEGGFSGQEGGRYRSDATAWATFVLGAAKKHPDLVQAGRKRLSWEAAKLTG